MKFIISIKIEKIDKFKIIKVILHFGQIYFGFCISEFFFEVRYI